MTLEELRLNIKWWESRRWIFNLFVGLSGIIGLYNGFSNDEFNLNRSDFFGIILWAFYANICYSIGTLLEVFDWYYLKNKIGIKKFRLFFFIVGILFSSFLTLWCAWLFSAKPHLW